MATTRQIAVNMTAKESDTINGMIDVTEDGRHVVTFVQTQGTCEACDVHATIQEDGSVRKQDVYRLKGTRGGCLCLEHLKQQPYIAGGGV